MNIADGVRRESCEAWEYVILFPKIRGTVPLAVLPIPTGDWKQSYDTALRHS